MVPIERQCVLLQKSLRIKLSHLSRHTSEPMKNFIKIIETRPQSSKKDPNWI